MKILNFGSCNIDFVYKVDSIVRSGETITAISLNQYSGGKGLNQSIALARAGAEVYHAGCIGEDGDMLRVLLNDSGVNTTYLRVAAARTGHAIIQVDKNGENCIVIYGGANVMITKEQIDTVISQFDNGDFLLIQNEINNIEYIIEKARKRGLKIILNPSPFNSVIERINLNDIEYLILNETEAMCLSGTSNADEFALWVSKHCDNLKVVLTLGSKGCFYIGNATALYQPAFKVKAVDTTAAGDTFTGYFVASLCTGDEIFSCLRTASAAAAIAASHEGAAPSIPKIDYVKGVIDSLVPYPDNGIDRQKDVVREYLYKHIATAKLSELASLLNYSHSYTSRWIKDNMGHTFSELLQIERCKIAAECLKNSDMPISEVIEKAGYSNESFFRNTFYKIYKTLPLDYRKKHRKLKLSDR